MQYGNIFIFATLKIIALFDVKKLTRYLKGYI